MLDFKERIKGINTKAIFLHCPKTGGTYVCQHESKNKPVLSNLHNWGHSTVTSNKRELNPFYLHKDDGMNPIFLESEIRGKPVISIVRNHYDWLVSYFYHSGGSKSNKYYNSEHYDAENSAKGFEYLVKTICDRETLWPNNKFIFRQIFSSNSNMVVDFIARNHTLDADLLEISKILGLRYSRKSKERVGRPNNISYQKYFSDELVSLVEDTWKEELSLYGFAFEEFETNSPLVGRGLIAKDIKENIKYCGSRLIYPI